MSNASYGREPSAGPPPAPHNTQSSGSAIASMVLGILSFLFCGPLFSVPAVILGHGVLGKIRRGELSGDSRGFAMAGLILGYINLGIFALMILLVVLAGFRGGHVSPFVYSL